MKNLSKLALGLLLVGTTFTFVGCDDDDDEPTVVTPPPVDPTLTTFETKTETVEIDGASVTANVVAITDNGKGIGTRTLSSDTTYVLENLVFVNDGDELTIEPGTVIKGAPGSGNQATALVVASGGKINAVGTASNPIIFTYEGDNTYSTSNGVVTAGNASGAIVGQWGGIIVLGKASLNSSPGTSAIEGISTDEARGIYGGTDDTDNSGTLKYISIRHGGTDIGAGNEINGLTMGGVGSGTTIEYIEVFANKDDGFEWFGGTVNTKYLVSAYNQDDAMDYDEGWRGKNQYWLAYQRVDSDRGGEHDGGTDPETAQPYATPVIFNATYVGRGTDAGKRAVTFRDNAGGKYFNSIFTGYGKGVDVEFIDGSESSYNRFKDGDLEFANNILFDVDGTAFSFKGASDSDVVTQAMKDEATTYFSNNANITSDPEFGDNGIVPSATGVAKTASTKDASDSFFDDVDYRGAFEPGSSSTWIDNWTRLSAEF